MKYGYVRSVLVCVFLWIVPAGHAEEPIVDGGMCTLSEDSIQERLARIEALLESALLDDVVVEGPEQVRFRVRAEYLGQIEEMIELEQACCGEDVGIDVGHEEGEVAVVTLRAPAGVIQVFLGVAERVR